MTAIASLALRALVVFVPLGLGLAMLVAALHAL